MIVKKVRAKILKDRVDWHNELVAEINDDVAELVRNRDYGVARQFADTSASGHLRFLHSVEAYAIMFFASIITQLSVREHLALSAD